MIKRLFALWCLIFSFFVYANTPPTIDLGNEQFILAGTNAVFNPSFNDIDGDDLVITWKVLYSPTGSRKDLTNSSGVTTELFLDKVGTYVVEATINDGQKFVSDTVTVYGVETIGATVFGPINYIVKPKCDKTFIKDSSKSECKDNTDNFTIPVPGNDYSLILRNTGYISASVSLNDETIASFYDFSGSDETFVSQVNLLASNSLVSRVGGNLSANLEILVKENQLPIDNNQAPTISSADFEYFGNNSVFVTPTVSDLDPTDQLELVVVKQPRNGTISIEGGQLRFLPKINQTEDSTAIIGVIDSGIPRKISLTTVNVFFNTGNRPPVVTGALPLSEGEVVSFTPEIEDNLGDTHILEISTQPVSGLAEIVGNSVVYTPVPGYVGPVNFVLRVTDSGSPALSTDFSVNGQVGVNVAPELVGNDTFFPEQGNILRSSFNVVDVNENQTAFMFLETGPLHGAVEITPSGTFTYTPDLDFFGTDTFIVGVRDSSVAGLESFRTVTFNVRENAPPQFSVSQANISVISGQTISQTLFVRDNNRRQQQFFEIVKSPIGGVAEIQGNILTYTADLNFSGADEVKISVTDNGNPVKSSLFTWNINVTGNRAPSPTIFWARGSNEIPSGTQRAFTVAPNDPDNGQQFTYEIITQPTGGIVTENLFWPGRYTYTPSPGFSGNDSFEIRVRDNGSPSLEGTVTGLAIVTVNNPPSPNDLTIGIVPGLQNSTVIATNDPDIGQTHTYQIVNQPSLSTAMFVSNVLVINASQTASGSETFTVRVTDNGSPATSGDANITINYLPNSPPVLSNNAVNAFTIQDTRVSVNVSYVDPDERNGQGINITQVSPPSNGTIESFTARRGTIRINYIPNAGFTGTDSAQFQISDNGTPTLSDNLTVNFVVEQNSPPSPVAIVDDLLQGYVPNVSIFVEDGDPDQFQQHEYGIFAFPQGGEVIAVRRFSPFFLYVPRPEFFGADQIGFIVTEANVPFPPQSATTVATINIEENVPPQISFTGPLETFQSTSVTGEIDFLDPNQRIGVPSFRGNYQWSVFNNPPNGTVTVNSVGGFTYTPAIGFSGTDTFEIQVKETPSVELPQELSDRVTVSVNVIGNSNPTISYIPVSVVSGETVQGTVSYTDADLPRGQILNYEVIEQPSFGTVSFTNSLNQFSFNYTSTSFGGNDLFKVRVFDNAIPAGEIIYDVSINVEENLAPVINPIALNAPEGGTGTAQITFTDPNLSQTHTFSITQMPQFGSAQIDSSGLLSYSPNIGSLSDDQVTVRVTDSSNPPLFGEFVVPISVIPNTPPTLTASPSSITTFQSTQAQTQVSFTDPDVGQTHTYSIQVQPVNGSASIDQSGLVTFVPTVGFSGVDSFTVAVSDSVTPPGIGTLTINVTVEANTPPVLSATPPSLDTFQSTPISGQISFVDPDVGQDHTFGVATQGNKGSVSIDETGTYTYTPIIGESGSDTIVLSVTDNALPPATGTISIPINIEANTPPSVVGELTFETFQSTSATKIYSVSDVDSGQSLSLELSSTNSAQGGNVSLTNLGNGQYSVLYNPLYGFSGADSFILVAKDNANPFGVTNQTINVNVIQNTSPTVNSGTLSFLQDDNSKTFQVTFSDPDVGQSHTYSIPSNGTLGFATIDSNGLLTYTPNPGTSGTDTITVAVTDNAAPNATGTAQVSVTIDPNVAPVLTGPVSVDLLTSKSYTFQYVGTDPNPNQTLSYQVSQFSNEVSSFIDFNTGELTLIAGEFFVGSTSIEIEVRDSGNPVLLDTISLAINVTKGNTRPNPSAGDIDTLAGVVGTTQIFPNDPDVNDTHSYQVIANGANGVASVNVSGLVEYTPNPGFTGSDFIDVLVSDNGDPVLSQIVSIPILVRANTPPNPIGQSFDILAGRTLDFNLDPNDPDSGQSWAYSVLTPPTVGSVSVDEFGLISFSTLVSESGSGTFEISVTDNGNPALSGTATFNYNILPNNAPVVISENITVFKNTTVSGPLDWSDTNQELQTYVFSIITNPVNGVVSIDQQGNLTYTPNTDYVGPDSFVVRVTDDLGLFGEGTFTIDVTEGNTPPTINSVGFSIRDPNGPFKTRFRLNAQDSDGQIDYAVWNFGDGSQPSTITRSVVGDFNFERVFHQYNGPGSYNVSVEVFDELGASSTFNGTVNVTANSAPVAVVSADTVQGPSPLTVNLDSTGSTDDGTIVYTEWNVLETGANIVGPTAQFSFPNSGVYTVELYLEDDNQTVSFAYVKIAVDNPQVNQPPYFNLSSSYARSDTFPFDVTLSALGTNDFDGNIIDTIIYHDDIYGPDISFGTTGTYSYKRPGTYFPKILVRDDFEEAVLKEKPVHVGPIEAPLCGIFPEQIGPRQVKVHTLVRGHFDKNSFLWDFGDGNFSNLPEPEHTYATSGNYQIKLYYFDVYGALFESVYDIYIDDSSTNPVIGTTLVDYQEVVPGTLINFDFSSSSDPFGNPLDTTVIDFKNGNYSVDVFSTNETFNSIGVHDVEVFVVNDRGVASRGVYFINVISGDGPEPVASVDFQSGPAPHTFTLDATGSFHNSGTIVKTLWKASEILNEFGLQEATPNAVETITLEDPGFYNFELWVRDSLGNTRQSSIEIEVTN